MMQKLNPYSKTAAALEQKATDARKTARATALKKRNSKAGRAAKTTRSSRFQALNAGLEKSFADAHQEILDEQKAGQFGQQSESEEDDE